MQVDTYRPVVVLGAGGHGAVVCEVLQAAGVVVRGFADDAPGRVGTRVLDLPVVATGDLQNAAEIALIVGIGDNAARRRVFESFVSAGYRMEVAVHPSAVISPTAVVGAGAAVMAGVIVNARSSVGENAIMNTGCRVDHDCVIGPHAHIAPGSTLAGSVVVGQSVLIGAGAVVVPNIRIGDRAIVGAGAVVTADVPPGVTVVGVPARPMRS